MRRGYWIALGVAWFAAVACAAHHYFANRGRVAEDYGPGWVAKELCSCLWVGERSLESCRSDLPYYLAKVKAEVLEDERAVRGFDDSGQRIARYRDDGGGCTLH